MEAPVIMSHYTYPLPDRVILTNILALHDYEHFVVRELWKLLNFKHFCKTPKKLKTQRKFNLKYKQMDEKLVKFIL